MSQGGAATVHDGLMKLEASDFAALDDAGKLAVVETLMLVVYADGKVMPDEVRRFDAVVSALPLGLSPEVLKALIAGANQRMQSLSTPIAIADFVANLATRLVGAALREKVLFTMATMAEADGVLHPFERNLLGLFAVSFNLTSDRVTAIKDAVTAARPPEE